MIADSSKNAIHSSTHINAKIRKCIEPKYTAFTLLKSAQRYPLPSLQSAFTSYVCKDRIGSSLSKVGLPRTFSPKIQGRTDARTQFSVISFALVSIKCE